MLHYLQEHYARPLTRDSVAEAMGLHPNYLSSLCSDHSEEGFHAALEAIRLDRAEHLLRGGTMSAAAVAGSAGFSGDAHFRAAFKRRHGTTPGRWRREQGE